VRWWWTTSFHKSITPVVVSLFNKKNKKKHQKLTGVTVPVVFVQLPEKETISYETGHFVLLSYMCLSMFIILVLLQNCRDQKPPVIFEKTAAVAATCTHFSAIKMQKNSTQRWTTTVMICDGRPCLPVNYASGHRRSIWGPQPPAIWKHESMCDSCNHLSWNLLRSRWSSGFPQSIDRYLEILTSQYIAN
jgi:hypothetical protein